MLDRAFGPAHFDVDCFTALVVDARAKADIASQLRHSGRTNWSANPQRALSTTTGRCRTAGQPRNPLAGGDLLDITALMLSSFKLARADKTRKPAWSGRRDCPQAGIRSVNPPITMIRQRRPAEIRSEDGLSTLERIQIIGQRARQLNASAKSRTSPPSVAPLLHPYSRSDA